MRRLLEDEGWWVCRAAGSLGDADLVALKAFGHALLVEVKSTTRGPFHSFGPKQRQELLKAAKQAGATAALCWWPSRGEPKWIFPDDWPKHNSLEGGNGDERA